MDIGRVRGVIAQMKLSEKLALAGGGSVTAAVDRLIVPSVDLGGCLQSYAANEPSALALGCTFSADICAAVAKARSTEAAAARKAVAGSVCAGLIRDPMRADARDFFSEDALLTAELLTAYASSGVLGFVFTDALGQGRFVNRTADARALNELYLYPLARAGRYAAALQLDGGYINGEDVCYSRRLYDMYVKYVPATAMIVTQYGTKPPSGAFGSGAYILGMDGDAKKAMSRAIVNGEFYENRLNAWLERTVATAAITHEFYKNYDGERAECPDITFDSAVLLKNDGTLPASPAEITLFGDPAEFDDGRSYTFFSAKDVASRHGKFNLFLVTPGENGIPQDVCAAISATSAAAKTVVAVCGNAAELGFSQSVNAILFLPHCTRVADIIAMINGRAPRGRLSFTWAAKRGSYPCNNKKYEDRGDYRYESVFVGSSYFCNFGAGDTLYPFGHGLEYTSFGISALKVKVDKLTAVAEFDVENTGAAAGSAVCQAYLTFCGKSAFGLNKRLAAYKRVELAPGEKKRETLEINISDLALFDEKNKAFVTLGGKYRVDIGLSAGDIRCGSDIKLSAGVNARIGLSSENAPSYYATESSALAPAAPELEKLFGVPFIQKPKPLPAIAPPSPAGIKGALRRAEKSCLKRLLPLVTYRIKNTPIPK